MNVLKKQKQEEADLRREIETALNTLRNEKKQQDQKAAAGEKLAPQYRELHEISVKLHERATAALPDAKDLPVVPELDAKLLESLGVKVADEDKTDAKAENGSKQKSKKK
jgi:ethanolamine utilization protein EutA (predicted chaperonin)